jgi:hypothetical protein
VKLAHKGARASRVRFNDCQTVPSYREAFRAALVGAWAQAKRDAPPRCAHPSKSHRMRNGPPCCSDSDDRQHLKMLATVARIDA